MLEQRTARSGGFRGLDGIEELTHAGLTYIKVDGTRAALLAELGAGGSHRTVIVSTIDRRDGCSHRFAQDLCRPPELCCPCWISLQCYHVRQTLQREGNAQLVTHFSPYSQTLLIECTCCCVITLESLHSS